MPDLDWAKIKAATLMIGASAKSFDWRTASPEAIGFKVGDITGKLSVTTECREKLVPLYQFTVGERAFLDSVLDRGEIDVSLMGAPESVRAAIEACPALRWKVQNVRLGNLVTSRWYHV